MSRDVRKSAGGFPRLKDLFREAERQAREARKVLRHPRWKNLDREHLGSKDRAVGLANLVIAVARQGRKAEASQVSTLAEKLELLLELLRVEMCDLFGS